ncbi:hypothetical protein cyc_01366 [Cyclospora cayetanensis]|uniref:Uncharacterized protein n=1 Tax=Cyclospora cayetanensis TaxID=88456 RepID=A0A1D3CSZ6_9EIME|nr:hypothetical protein cyc_01366 [Cyclospora cayetanensis]
MLAAESGLQADVNAGTPQRVGRHDLSATQMLMAVHITLCLPDKRGGLKDGQNLEYSKIRLICTSCCTPEMKEWVLLAACQLE